MRSKAKKRCKSSPTFSSWEGLLEKSLQTITEKKQVDHEQVIKMWYDIVGAQLAVLTEPLHLKEGILTIKVKSATLYSLLSGQEKRRLLELLQKEFSKQAIRDLRFTVS